MKKALIYEIAFGVNIITLIDYHLFINKWLINCQQSDLCAKLIDILNKNYRVCNDHFKNKMFSNVERTRLLPNAILTEFGNYNETCIETTENDTTNKTIGDDLLTDKSIVTSTPLKQNQSVSVACKYLI